MATRAREGTRVQDSGAEWLNWSVIGLSVAVWPWLDALWLHMPTPTAIYMLVSAGFMLFQMSDKLGMLERLKRRRPPPLDKDQR